MKNIINLNKFTLEHSKNFYAVSGILLLLSLLGENKIVSLCCTLNFLILIDMFIEIKRTSNQVKGDEGTFIFLAPVKNSEFVFSKIIKILILFAVTLIADFISGIKFNDFMSGFKLFRFDAVTFSFSFSSSMLFFILYMILSIIIINSIRISPKKRGLIFALNIIIFFAVNNILSEIIYFLPYVDIIIMGIRIRIIDIVIKTAFITALTFLTIKIMDKKLDIF